MERYNIKSVEKKWQDIWDQNKTHSTTIDKKRCNVQQQCSVKKISSTLEHELQVAILKKAVLLEKELNKGKKKFKRSEIN